MKQNSKEHILVIRHVFEKFLGESDLSAYDQFVAEDVIGHCSIGCQELHSPEAFGRDNTKIIDQQYAQAFQFIDVDMGEIIAHGDKIFVRWKSEGVHRGSFFGKDATHRQFSLAGQSLYRFDSEGKIAETWQSWDMLGLLRQIDWWTPASPTRTANRDLDQLSQKASRLSERERDCLKLLLQGKTAKDSAAILFVSARTIEYYFENLKNKLDASSKKEVFAIARQLEKHNFL